MKCENLDELVTLVTMYGKMTTGLICPKCNKNSGLYFHLGITDINRSYACRSCGFLLHFKFEEEKKKDVR